MGKFANKNNSQPAKEEEVIEATYSPLDGMTSSDKFWAGMGKAFTDTGRGVVDLVYDALPGEQWGEAEHQQNIAESRVRDEALMDSGWGTAGNISGNIASFAPSMFVPGANTYTGAALIGGTMGALQPTTEQDSRLTNSAITATGGMLGKYVGGKLADAAKSRVVQEGVNKVQNTVKDATAAMGQRLGYKIPPTQVNPGLINKSLEGLSGKISTAQQASIKNQQITDDLARKSLGLNKNAPLTMETLKQIRRDAGKAYQVITKKGILKADDQYIDDIANVTKQYDKLKKEFPTQSIKEIDNLVDDVMKDSFDSENAVFLVRKLRKDGSSNLKSFDDPKKANLGSIQRKLADTMEDLMERNIGGGDLKDFRSARQTIAKTYSLQSAMDDATGHVKAISLSNQLSKGVPLSGELKTIAKMGQAFPKAMQKQDSSFIGLSPLDYFGGLMGVGATGGNAIGAVGLLARPAARAAILSKPYQNLMVKPNYNATGVKAIHGLLSNPYGQAAMRLSPSASIGLLQ